MINNLNFIIDIFISCFCQRLKWHGPTWSLYRLLIIWFRFCDAFRHRNIAVVFALEYILIVLFLVLEVVITWRKCIRFRSSGSSSESSPIILINDTIEPSFVTSTWMILESWYLRWSFAIIDSKVDTLLPVLVSSCQISFSRIRIIVNKALHGLLFIRSSKTRLR
jgi:hypothetical protein